jgi:hypothetical protein
MRASFKTLEILPSCRFGARVLHDAREITTFSCREITALSAIPLKFA